MQKPIKNNLQKMFDFILTNSNSAVILEEKNQQPNIKLKPKKTCFTQVISLIMDVLRYNVSNRT